MFDVERLAEYQSMLLCGLPIVESDTGLMRPACSVSAVIKDLGVGAGVLGFDFRAGQITHSVANRLPPQQRFFRAVLLRRYAAKMSPATRYTLGRNTASITRI